MQKCPPQDRSLADAHALDYLLTILRRPHQHRPGPSCGHGGRSRFDRQPILFDCCPFYYCVCRGGGSFQHDSSPLSAFDLYLDPHVSLGRRRSSTSSCQNTCAAYWIEILARSVRSWVHPRSALSDFDMVTAIPHIISAAVFSGAFGSLISAGITSGLDGVHGIAGWRWLFIVEGVTTCAVALISPFILLDYPQTTKKFTQEERDIAYYRLLEDGVSSPTNNRLGHFKAFTLAVRDWRVWLLGFAYMSILSGFSFTYFFPTLVRGLGYQDRTMAQLMTAPLFLVALVVAIPTCWVADRMPDKRIIFIVTALAVGVIFDALAASIVSNVPRYIFLCFINSATYTASPLALSYSSTCLSPVEPEKRAVALALINGLANLAQLYGSAVFPTKDAPRYLTGFTVFTVLVFVGVLAYAAAHVLFKKYPFKATSSHVSYS